MLLNAARGTTYEQISEGLNIHPNDVSILNNLYNKALNLIDAVPEKKLTLGVANKVYVGSKPSNQFNETLTNFYGTTALKEVNFRSDHKLILKEINEYISSETDGMITEMLDDTSVQSDTAFVSVNAFYFKGYFDNMCGRLPLKLIRNKILYSL